MEGHLEYDKTYTLVGYASWITENHGLEFVDEEAEASIIAIPCDDYPSTAHMYYAIYDMESVEESIKVFRIVRCRNDGEPEL